MDGTLTTNAVCAATLPWARRAAVCLCLAFPWAVSALGPEHPFTPPGPSKREGQDDNTVAETAISTGLAGVRLGVAPQALIDGQWFAVGMPVRAGRLLSVQPHAVTLRFPDGRLERLPLFPAPPAQPASSANTAAPANLTIVKRVLP